MTSVAALAELIHARAAACPPREGASVERFIVALCGPPGSGKSTLASALVRELGAGARIVPMDGFHLDDGILNARGIRAFKGRPETFDPKGLAHLLGRMRHEEDVYIPTFDRSLEISRAGADQVVASDRILIVEGTFVLLDMHPWTELHPHYDLTIGFDLPEAMLEERLLARWRGYGFDEETARQKALGNDIPNGRLVMTGSRPPEIRIGPGGIS